MNWSVGKLKVTIVMLLISLMLCAGSPVEAASITVTNSAHASGCYHVHTSGCNHVHDSGCYATLHTHNNDKFTEFGGCKRVLCTKCDAWCKILGSASDKEHWAKCVVCNMMSSADNTAGSGSFSIRWNECGKLGGSVLVCSKVYSCGLEGASSNCQAPTISAVNEGKSGWTNAANDTMTISAQNATQYKLGSGAWQSSNSFTITENAVNAIQIKSATGHIVSVNAAVNHFDRLEPDVPIYEVE